jgi:hypothetical protein
MQLEPFLLPVYALCELMLSRCQPACQEHHKLLMAAVLLFNTMYDVRGACLLLLLNY